MKIKTCGVIGAGAWGTALAITVHRAGLAVKLWAMEEEVVVSINEEHRNNLFLPDVDIPEDVNATNNLAIAAAADLVLLVVPAQHLRHTCQKLAPVWSPGVPVVICSKGIEQGTGALMSQVVSATLTEAPLIVLSGPTFAKEVAVGLPSAITLACADENLSRDVSQAIGTPNFRPYQSDDVVSAEMGGAVKNVLAIACGIVQGRGFGDSARAALITRGLTEIGRLAVALGGKPETLMGLCGLGDLMLTATSMQSRNYSLGVALGEGKTLDSVLNERRAVTEGVHTAKALHDLANKNRVGMPICAAVYAVLHQDADIDTVVRELLDRPFREELDFTH